METLYIVKGGAEMLDHQEKRKSILSDFSKIPGRKIFVHGGGKVATEIGKIMGIESVYEGGRRITGKKDLDLVVQVYAGLINKNIVADLQFLSCNAFGFSGADGGLIPSQRRSPGAGPENFAGDILPEMIPVSSWKKFLESEWVPVVAPITFDPEFGLLNSNADGVASALALALSRLYRVKLIYLFDKPGVLDVSKETETVFPVLEADELSFLKEEGIISGGMLPKLHYAFQALDGGVGEVCLGGAENFQEMLGSAGGTRLVLKKEVGYES
jgi:acetylglutamate kinase